MKQTLSQSVTIEAVDNILVIEVDNPPVNAMSSHVRIGVVDAIAKLNNDPEVAAGLILCAGRTFIAGADITEFKRKLEGPSFNEVMNTVEASEKPVMAALHGTVLGGGMELALACHYRVGLETVSLGLPEVKLGIMPGAGGTQRMPRLVPLQVALEIIAEGRVLSANEGLEFGVLDKIVEADLRDGALAFLKEKVQQGEPLRRVSEIELTTDAEFAETVAEFRQRIAQAKPGYLAPGLCVTVVEAAYRLPFAEGLCKEAELFQECRKSIQSRALQYLFFCERQASSTARVDASFTSLNLVGTSVFFRQLRQQAEEAGIAITDAADLVIADSDASADAQVLAASKRADTGLIQGIRVRCSGVEGRWPQLLEITGEDPAILQRLKLLCKAVGIQPCFVKPFPYMTSDWMLAHLVRFIEESGLEADNWCEMLSAFGFTQNPVELLAARGLCAVDVIAAGERALNLEPRDYCIDQDDLCKVEPPALVRFALYQLLMAGIKLSEAGILARVSDIDILAVFALKFPRYLGGPVFYAKELGSEKVLAELRALELLEQGSGYLSDRLIEVIINQVTK